MNQDEGFFALRGAAITLALGGQVGVVFNDDQAIDDAAELGAQRDGAPILQSADRQHDAFIHVGDGRHPHHHRQQLFPFLLVFAQQAAHFFTDVNADGLGGCFAIGQRDFLGVEFMPVQVRKQERDAVCGNLHSQQATALRFEGNHVRRPAAVGLAFAQRFNQAGR